MALEQAISAALKEVQKGDSKEVSASKKKAAASPQDLQKIKKITDQVDTIRNNRTVFERQWLINLAFLYGKQYFTIEKKPVSSLDERIYWELKNMERKKKTRRVSNYILPLYRSLLSKMMMMKSTVNIEATTNTERDRGAAKIAQECSEDFFQNCNKNNPILCQDYASMQLVLKQLFSYCLSMGNGWLYPFFNPKTRTKAFLAGKISEDVEIGEVEVEVLHNFDVFADPLRRYIIRQRIMSLEQIKDVYDIDVEDEKLQLDDYASRLINMIEGSYDVKYDRAAKVYEKWELPSDKFKKGRHIIAAKEAILLEEDLPEEYKGRLPLHKFDYLDLLFGIVPYAQSMIEQLVSLQEEYNYTITRLAGYKKWMAGKVMIPRKSKISSKWDDEVGQLIFFNTGFGVPQYMNPPAPPAFLGEDIMRIRRDMEDIAGVHDTSLGRIPQQAKSGVAIENLSELDTSQLAPQLVSLEQKLSFFMETVLEIMQTKYAEGRFLEITGELYGQEVKSFKGADIIGNRRVRVSLGSSMPNSKQARQTFILELEKRGFISKEKAKELLEFGDVEGIYHSLDEQAAKEENNNLIGDQFQVQAELWEDHPVHLKTHTDFMKTADWMKLPDTVKKKFIEHMKQHQQFLLAESTAAAGGEGKPPLSAPAMPPAGGGMPA